MLSTTMRHGLRRSLVPRMRRSGQAVARSQSRQRASLSVSKSSGRSHNALGTFASVSVTSTAMFLATRNLHAAAAVAPTAGIGTSDGSQKPSYPEIILYQYKICPYCNKVKAVLDFLGIPYSALEVNPVTKEEIKGDDFDGYKKVPVTRIGGEQVNDSPVILGRILELAAERGEVIGAIDDEQRKWMEWVDRKLAVLLFPNITRSMDESMQAFAYIWDVPHFTTFAKVLNRYAGAVAMRLAQGKIKKKFVPMLDCPAMK